MILSYLGTKPNAASTVSVVHRTGRNWIFNTPPQVLPVLVSIVDSTLVELLYLSCLFVHVELSDKGEELDVREGFCQSICNHVFGRNIGEVDSSF